ncbi:hypothetical protein R6Q57_016638 [Mikania cordata]
MPENGIKDRELQMENPVICESFIQDFWNTATLNPKGDNEVGTIEGKIQNVDITISEVVIRDVLLFGDKFEDPIEYPKERVFQVLRRMSYEGEYPPTLKKLLHPYWRLLAHVLQMCIGGNKGGTYVLNKELSWALVALTLGWRYNFSKMIFEEMKNNLKGLKKGIFMMYPRFIQMVLNDRYPGLEQTIDKMT